MDYSTAGGALTQLNYAKTKISSLKTSIENQSIIKTEVPVLQNAIESTSSRLSNIKQDIESSQNNIRSIMTTMQNIENKVKGVN